MPTDTNLAAARWHKSSRSGANGNCVEVAENLDDVVLVRDTKDRGIGLVLRVPPGAWAAFLVSCKDGEFDHV